MYLYIIEYIIVIIILNKLLSARSVSRRKIKALILPALIPSLILPFLCRSQFLNYFIFLFYVEVVLSFLA